MGETVRGRESEFGKFGKFGKLVSHRERERQS